MTFVQNIYSLTMTTVFCLLLFLRPTAHCSHQNLKIQRFSYNSSYHFNESSQIYIGGLRMTWMVIFQDKVVRQCTRNIASPSFVKMLTYSAKQVDKLQTMNNPLCSCVGNQNFHRLSKLVYHTIPTFGHVRVISEMQFEKFHQTLNQYMTLNPHNYKHIIGIYHTICSDW